jgi:osmoprotectant transport system ATP-binding protein
MIRFEDVVKVYPGGARAVDGLTFTIGEGECVVFVGPSGCGKTTTLKLANQLLRPTSGRIFVAGHDIATRDPITLRRGIGYVIQDVGLLPHMTVIENVGLVPRLVGWPRARILTRARELLDLVGLPPAEFAMKHPHQLSGGQRQRVGVARAMAADPPVILMDEPFGALDPVTRAQLQDEFLRLRTRVRKTILFITHDIDEAVRLGDRIAVMRSGRIVQLEPPAGVLRRPADEFVRQFVGRDRAMKLLKLARVRDLVERRVAKAAAHDDIETTRRMMRDAWSDTLAVVGSDGTFRGVLTFQDLEGRAGPVGGLRVRAFPTTSEDQSLHEAMATMLVEGVAWLPVLDDRGGLVGAVTISAFARLTAAPV